MVATKVYELAAVGADLVMIAEINARRTKTGSSLRGTLQQAHRVVHTTVDASVEKMEEYRICCRCLCREVVVVQHCPARTRGLLRCSGAAVHFFRRPLSLNPCPVSRDQQSGLAIGFLGANPGLTFQLWWIRLTCLFRSSSY